MPVTRKSTPHKSAKQADAKPVAKKQASKPAVKEVAKKSVKQADKPVAKKQAEKPAAKKQAEKPAAKKPVEKKEAEKPVEKKQAKKPVEKKVKPVKETKSEELESSDEEEQEEEELTEEQEEALRKEILGDLASSEGEDSSDDEDAIGTNEEIVALDGKKMEESQKETKAIFDKKQAEAKKTTPKNTGVIYLGRIPHGFYEKEMKAYFKQFGAVNNVRVARNRKSGASKHFGFIEFKEKEVAEIVAETMHNYLLFGHLLQCRVIPSESVHKNLFKGSRRTFKPTNHRAKHIAVINKKRTGEELVNQQNKLRKSEKRLRESLKASGIDYDFPGYDAKA